MTVGIVRLLLGPQASQENALQPEQLRLLLGVEELQVGVVDHVQTPPVLPRLLVADDDLLSQLVESVLFPSSKWGGGRASISATPKPTLARHHTTALPHHHNSTTAHQHHTRTLIVAAEYSSLRQSR